MEQLRDIKDIVEVPEYSFEILLTIIILTLTILAVAIYFYKNRRKRRKKLSKREIALNSLKSIDYKNPKDVAYRFTLDGAVLIEKEQQNGFDNLVEELERYKYRKDVPPLDKNLEHRVKEFIKELK